ncbi:hypothetical protein [Phytomonospora endophytica]|uniref:Asp23/Gls24 family envelope stress response protein n=1 Tax=Phytomonospora endophytica TaxID=714109 RepID=A0A841FTK8_9ACTN|nr:hypothetical protein [Phytomonospora endophytica]MBB6039124.1 hypothetical protein [Phytomonospora endophytica]GIG67639.1 hypothetical protein Pen01_39340 [Phytomonospora endophytica]
MTHAHDRGAFAKELHDAIVKVPGVTRLVSSSPVEVATHFAGGRVAGLRLSGDVVEVHVAVDRVPVEPVAEKVRALVTERLAAEQDGRPVAVTVADLDLANLPRPKGG